MNGKINFLSICNCGLSVIIIIIIILVILLQIIFCLSDYV
jgi:hypothetical protein